MSPLDCYFDFASPAAVIRHCAYCRRELDPVDWTESALRATRDHVWPHALKHLRPDDQIPRKVWACCTCNQLKSDLLPLIWYSFMQDTPHWWKTPAMIEHRRKAIRHYYDPNLITDIKDVAIVIGLQICRRVHTQTHPPV